jgi:pimeloyl-ACP methyl ester carboxylesterase
VSIASPLTRPSPNGRRVGIRIVTFEACSGFTHVTARQIAQPPEAAFVTRLQPSRLPGRAARQLPDQSTTLWVESSSTDDSRLRGALPKADIFMIDPEEQARLAYADPKIGEEAAQRVGADKYQDLAILNRIASARFGWQPRFFNPRLERWLHRVNVPTHVIWGEADRIIPSAYGEAFHRLIPGSTLTMIPNAGHLPHVERAGAVAQAMQTFLRN